MSICPHCHDTGDVYCTKKQCSPGCPIPGKPGHDKSWGGYYRVNCVCSPDKQPPARTSPFHQEDTP
jgi:hypothetical protein